MVLNFNDDSTGIRGARVEDAAEYIRRWVDQLLDEVGIDQYVLSVALPDIVMYRSEVGELYGRRFLERPELLAQLTDGYDPKLDHKLHGAKVLAGLIEQGTDVIEVVGRRVHEHGKEFFVEMRMGDTHHRRIDPLEFNCPQIALDHPEWAIRRTDLLPEGLQETALDYSIPEVREHRLAIVAELAHRQEVDGLELNFVRWLKFFQRELAPEKAPIMTEFVGRVREILAAAARRRGREPICLGARVPSTVEECRLAGLDPRQWVQRGYVDCLTVADWNWCNPQIHVEAFAEFTQPANCRLLVQMGDGLGGMWTEPPSIRDGGDGLVLAPGKDGYSGLRNTDAHARACAHNVYSWGGEGISFWNVYCRRAGAVHTYDADYRRRMLQWMNQVASLESVSVRPRRYHYLPLWKWPELLTRLHPHREQYHSPAGGRHCQILTFDPMTQNKRQAYAFRMADGRNGEDLQGTLRCWIYHLEADDRVEVDVNGRNVAAGKIKRVPAGTMRGGLPGARLEIALADCPPFQGDNELGLTVAKRRQREAVPYMEELDILVC